MSAPTAAGPASATAAATPTRPATTRVTILTGKRMTDLALPAAAPIETYIDDAVAMLADMLADAPAEVMAGFDFAEQGTWAFTRPGAPPLKSDQSLEEAAVVDGSLLTLVAVSRTERYRPLVEDVIDAIAVFDESPEFDRASLNRFVKTAIPFVSPVLALFAALAWWHSGQQLWWPLGLGLGALAALGGSVVAQKFYSDSSLSANLMLAAFPLAAVAVGLAVPRPAGVHGLGAPQLAGAAGVVLLLALVTKGGPRRRVELGAFVAVTAFAVTGAAIGVGYGGARWVPGAAIVFGLLVVTAAAKLTIAVARIALPPIPVPGEAIEHEELLDPVASEQPIAEETSTWQAIINSVPDSAARVAERSHLAKQLLAGFVTAGTLVLVVGVIALLVRGHFFVQTLVVAGLVTIACGFRSRLYADPRCSWVLLAAAVAIPTGVLARLSLWYPHYAWMFFLGYVVLGLVAVAGVAASSAARRASPVTKRILELFDGGVVAAIFPMLLWIAGVYDMVRNIQL